jgi:hypothetical protein
LKSTCFSFLNTWITGTCDQPGIFSFSYKHTNDTGLGPTLMTLCFFGPNIQIKSQSEAFGYRTSRYEFWRTHSTHVKLYIPTSKRCLEVLTSINCRPM